MRTIRPTLLTKELLSQAKADIPTMVWGASGIGKSEIIQQVAKELNASYYDIRCNLYDPVDVRGGLKVERQSDGTYKTKYGIPEDWPDSNSQGTLVLNLEELNASPKATMNAFLQLVLDRRIGIYKLPKNTIIYACGNQAKDRAAVQAMPDPLKRRFAHYCLEPNIDDTSAHFVNRGVDPSIIAFLRYRPEALHDYSTEQEANPSPRAWMYLNKKLPFLADEYYGCASIVGDGAAGEFISFRQIYKDLPDIDSIINNPSISKVPESMNLLYAVSAALASRANKANFKNICKYAKRLPAEFQVLLMKDAVGANDDITDTPEYETWINDNIDVLL